ncbi:MAG: PCYCGC domain-containing protein [Chloroflexi bacterium]|nr:PCYCGC domain-containing protein [Chloroflexota bacterium]
MTTPRVPARRPWSRRLWALIPVFIVSLMLGGSVAGCSNATQSDMPAAAGGAAEGTTTVVVPMGNMTMPTADEVSTTWAVRPDYVKGLPADWQAAYAFALARPDVVQWMPCYCGCEGMGHRSNLDCFFQRREVKGNYTYEEHGSFCDICVKTANMASDMLQQGKTMVQIRAAVDSTFGDGSAPGTDTPLPPAS